MTDRPVQPSIPPRVGPIARYGPVSLVLAAIVATLAFVQFSDRAPAGEGASRLAATVAKPEAGERLVLPDGVMSWPVATRDGIADQISWGDRCDTATGLLKLPQLPRSDCFRPFVGDNGGATTPGVTADEIRIVIYQPMRDDPVLKFIYDQIGNSDSIDDSFATSKGFVEIFNRYYELYGRKVVLEQFVASGPISDATSAVADAETIARDIRPFFVIGGPQMTPAFADTLAANQVMCIACATGQTAEWYADRAPYVWDVLKNADQGQQMLAEYLGKRLWNRPAEYAGDAAMHTRTRVFGLVHVATSDASVELRDRFLADLKDNYDMTVAAVQSYASPVDLTGSGKDIITKMKEAGVTTVVFSGDPLGPQYLTKIATEQDYFPEWVLGVTQLVDTTVFSRTYDQRQWAHAFGPSNLFVRMPSSVAGPGHLYRWYFGEDPPAGSNVQLLAGPLQVIYGALQGVGPNVTPEMFEAVLFGAPIIPSTLVSAQVSFGDRGVFPDPDYAGLDDQVEVWWDPEATGVSEVGTEGTGMWRYVDSGKRYLLGSWPQTEPKLFDRSNAIVEFTKAPPGADIPDYAPLR